jgi:hypothetical protein
VNAVWSLAAQTGRFAWTPALLPVATACAATAYGRLQRTGTPSPLAGITSSSTGLLLGWTALASVVNLAAGAVLAGAGRSSPRTVVGSVLGLLGASGAVAGAVARSDRGTFPVAVASGWGLVTLAATSRRPLGVRVAAALGAAGIITAALRKRGRH